MSTTPPRTGLPRILYPLVEWIRRTIVRKYMVNGDIVVRRFKHYPHVLYPHPTNICNARCVFCSYKSNPEDKVVAKTELFNNAVEQWLAKAPKNNLIDVGTNNGDSLIDPGLFDKLRHARAKGVTKVHLVTNGILLSRGDICDQVVELVDIIAISVPGFDREDYKRVFGVDKSEQVLEGILKLAETKRTRGSNIRIELQFRIDRPWQEVQRDPGMIQIKPYLDDGTIVFPPEQIRGDAMFTWGGVITDADMPGTMKLKHMEFTPNRRPCRNIFKDLAVLPEGQVRVCSCQYMVTNIDELVIGDLRENTLEDIFFGPRHLQLIKDQAEGRWSPVCANCSIYQSINFTPFEYIRLITEVVVSKAKRLTNGNNKINPVGAAPDNG